MTTTNKTNTDQATARPWRIVQAQQGYWQIWSAYDDSPGSRNNYVIADGIQSKDEAALIVQAVNERDALLAVAEAAKRMLTSTEKEYAQARLATALNTLATLREGKE